MSSETAADSPRAYRVEEVAERLDVSRSTVFRLIKAGALESVKVRGSRRVTAEQLQRFLVRAS